MVILRVLSGRHGVDCCKRWWQRLANCGIVVVVVVVVIHFDLTHQQWSRGVVSWSSDLCERTSLFLHDHLERKKAGGKGLARV
jgi:hypothetical protein